MINSFVCNWHNKIQGTMQYSINIIKGHNELILLKTSLFKMHENDLFTLPGHICATLKQSKTEHVPTEIQLQGHPTGYMQTRLIADYRTKFDHADMCR